MRDMKLDEALAILRKNDIVCESATADVAEICGNSAKELFLRKYDGLLEKIQLVADAPLVEFLGLSHSNRWQYRFNANTDFGRIPFACFVDDDSTKANWVFFNGCSEDHKRNTLRFLKMLIDDAEENGNGKSQGNQGVYWLSKLYEYMTDRDTHGKFFHVNCLIGAMEELKNWRKYTGGEDVLNKYKEHQESLERERENAKYHSRFD